MERPLSAVLLFGFLLVAFFGVMALLLNASIIPFADRVFGQHTIYAHGDMPIRVDIADTDAKRQVGLASRSVIAAGEGMLFTFEEDAKWRVWMKDMKFGIDILWLDKDGKILDIREYVYPDSYPDVFEPKSEARYILEVIVGYTSANGIQVGNKLDLNLK